MTKIRSTNSDMLDLIYAQMPAKPDDTVQVQHFFGMGHYVRMSEVPKGRGICMHVHSYDHRTIVAAGGGRLIKEDSVQSVHAGDSLMVRAGERHAFIAEEDTIWLCVHPTTDAEARALYGVKLEA